MAVMLLVLSSLGGVSSSFPLQQLLRDLFVFFSLSFLLLSLLTIPLFCRHVSVKINLSKLLKMHSYESTVGQS